MSSGDEQYAGSSFKVGGAEIIWETFPEETVIVDLAAGVYFTTVGSGAFLWSGLTQGKNLEELEAALRPAAAEAGQTDSLGSDIRAFVASLAQNGLIVPASSDENATGGIDTVVPPNYTSPQLVKRDDLSHLLAIDPPTPDLIMQMQKEGGGTPI